MDDPAANLTAIAERIEVAILLPCDQVNFY